MLMGARKKKGEWMLLVGGCQQNREEIQHFLLVGANETMKGVCVSCWWVLANHCKGVGASYWLVPVNICKEIFKKRRRIMVAFYLYGFPP